MASSNQRRDIEYNWLFDQENPVAAQSIEILASSIKEKLSTLPLKESYGVCIYKVPEKFRKVNEEAYTPRLVSIGPLHHGKIHLQGMEEYKLRFLHGFLERYKVGLNDVIRCILSWESFVRIHYPDNTELSDEVFREMILLDGIFIVQLFLMNYFPQMNDINQWMRNDLLHDMMLLENQLPSVVPRKLLDLVKDSLRIYSPFNNGGSLSSDHFPNLEVLAHKYFENVGNTANIPLPKDYDEAPHLVEFLRHLHAPSRPRSQHLYRRKFEYSHSATELQEAGVKFKMGTESCLFEILFKDGVLTIPRLRVNEWTETFFRNLIAFEQCQRQTYKDISSYIILMDSLINTPHDVDLLVQYGIINNLLGESEEVANLFNNLYKETIMDRGDFYFTKLCEDLNDYSRDYWHQWKAAWFKWKLILKHDYFGNPWSIISVIAAGVLLILTLLQTLLKLLCDYDTSSN